MVNLVEEIDQDNDASVNSDADDGGSDTESVNVDGQCIPKETITWFSGR